MADEKHTYPGREADVTWHGRLCIHIGECGRAQNALFQDGREPWCQPDLVQIGSVVDVVERCPSGALTYERKDGGPGEEPAPENVIHVAYQGPLFVRGDLEIHGADEDMEGVRFRAALCRCGASKNKPFCDNSHEEIVFTDSGAVGVSGKGYDEPGGKLEIKPVKNGPLRVHGNHAIMNGSGRIAYRGTRSVLCRCGMSSNKPFCDGTHKSVGFQAD